MEKKTKELWLQFIHPKTKPTIWHSRTIHICMRLAFLFSVQKDLRLIRQLLNKKENK